MSLPYPHEIETKDLGPHRHRGPVALDMRTKVEDLVNTEDRDLVIAGCALQTPNRRQAHELRRSFRRAIKRRFTLRRPNATESTWRKFVRTLQEMLSSKTKVQTNTLPQILSLIDAI